MLRCDIYAVSPTDGSDTLIAKVEDTGVIQLPVETVAPEAVDNLISSLTLAKKVSAVMSAQAAKPALPAITLQPAQKGL